MSDPIVMTAAVVILTMGDRAAALAEAVASVRDQDYESIELVVVSNGGAPGHSSADVVVDLDENVGVPAGRNEGIAATEADVIFFLDDDGRYAAPGVVADVMASFEKSSDLAIVSLRVRDEDGVTSRRHVPRVRVGDPGISSHVTTFLGGACAIRAVLFEEVGLLPGEFFYAHEETDFAWRCLDAGYHIDYRGDLVVIHPAAAPSRHGEYFFQSARNRVWLARRRLPWLIGTVYVAVWSVLSLVRPASRVGWRDTIKGLRAGFIEPAGVRHPMAWSTVARMTRLGRPPVI